MKLIRLKVVNWKRLPSLEIGPLGESVTVIHGPNRAGKSTLAEAIKKGLFDKFKGKADDLIPWSAPDAVPEVEVEFSVGGRRYLVQKRFSSRKSGGCNLFELGADGQRRELASGAEVDEEIQRLLASSGKNAGVPKMLWVRQGEVDVPELDAEFTDRLRALLGSVIVTETDDAVRKLLAEELAKCFTDAVIKSKNFFAQPLDLSRLESLGLKKGSASSPLSRLQEQIGADEKILGDLDRRLAEFEQDMETAQSVRDDLQKARRDASEAKAELQALRADEGRIEEKKKLAETSRRALDQARDQSRTIRRDREGFEKCVRALAEREQTYQARRAEADAGKTEQDRLKTERDHGRDAIHGLEDQLAELEAGTLIEIKQRILDLTDEIGRIEEGRQRVKRLEDEIAEDRSRLRAIVVAPETTDRKIVKLLDRTNKLRAELEASQLHFTLRPERDLAVRIALDHGESREVAGRAGEDISRQARQSLDLIIPGVGQIAFGRGEQNEGLEQSARELDEAGRELAALLTPLGIEPTASTAEIISELRRRKEQVETLRRNAENKELERKQLGDRGSAELAGESKRLESERANLVGSREELKDWVPSRAALAEEKKGFDEKRGDLKDRLTAAKKKLAAAEKELDRATDRQKQLGEEMANAAARFKVAQEEMADLTARHESLEKLDALIAAAERELEELGREDERRRLTPEELKFGERLRQAQDLVTSRIEFEGRLDRQEAALEERLRGMEGLHAKKIGLEQKLAAARRDQARTETRVKALAILAQTFDGLRDRGVESSLKPVTEQIEPWLRELYGSDAKKIIFGAGMRAEKIVTAGGEFSKFDAVTSHGELEQLATLVRLAYAVALARDEPQLVILDDPLAHSDSRLRQKMHAILEDAARKNLQLVIFTCNREGFDRINGARIIDLAVAGSAGALETTA